MLIVERNIVFVIVEWLHSCKIISIALLKQNKTAIFVTTVLLSNSTHELVFYTQMPFKSKSDAFEAVSEGRIWGFVNIPNNYTEYMKERMLTKLYADNDTLDGTIIGIHMDMSSNCWI